MATRLLCDACETILTIHCGNPACDWWRCRNVECGADCYEIHSGRIRLKSGLIFQPPADE